jgi:hypothetical protein
VSPNQFHYAHIGEWAEAFPAAIAWASPRVRERARARHVDIEFTRDEAARTTFAESVGRYRGSRFTSQAALATEINRSIGASGRKVL